MKINFRKKTEAPQSTDAEPFTEKEARKHSGTSSITRKSRMALTTKRNLMGYWFVLPFFIGLVLFYIPALIESFQFSVNNIIIGGETYVLEDAGWSFYHKALFEDAYFVRGIVESMGSMLLNVLIILIYSLIIATLLNRNIGGKSFYRAMLFLPVIIASGVIVTANNMTLSTSNALATQAGNVAGGLFSQVDIKLLLNSLNISSKLTGIVSSAVDNIYTIVTSSGVQLIIFLAGLQSISPAIYESANVEGATWWEGFWKITIPMISPLILVNMVYTIVDSFTSYNNTVMRDIFDLITNGAYSDASARSFIYLAVVGVVISIVVAVVNRFVFYENK